MKTHAVVAQGYSSSRQVEASVIMSCERSEIGQMCWKLFALPLYRATSAPQWHQPCDPDCSVLDNVKSQTISQLINMYYNLIAIHQSPPEKWHT